MITSGNYEQGTGAKRALMLGMVVLICTPMVVSLLLLLAVAWPKMDAVTLHLPKGVRATVASGILAGSDYNWDKAKQQRAKRLDAETAAAYRPPTILTLDGVIDRKVSGDDLVEKAVALEKEGKECDAEELYTQATGKNASNNLYKYPEAMGRSGLRCGDLPGARAGLEVAILKEKKFIEDAEDSELDDAKQDLMMDQQFLIIVYQKEHETALAKQTCSDAHPGATSCTCKLIANGVNCSYKPK